MPRLWKAAEIAGGIAMGKTQQIQKEMMAALKAKDTRRKDALSLMLSSLKAKAKDERRELTEDEENALILKEIKQTKETLDGSIKAGTNQVLSEFAPQEMSADEIRKTVSEVLGQLGISAPSPKDKGIVMKTLMPLVKGKADGKLVNQIVGEFLNK